MLPTSRLRTAKRVGGGVRDRSVYAVYAVRPLRPVMSVLRLRKLPRVLMVAGCPQVRAGSMRVGPPRGALADTGRECRLTFRRCLGKGGEGFVRFVGAPRQTGAATGSMPTVKFEACCDCVESAVEAEVWACCVCERVLCLCACWTHGPARTRAYRHSMRSFKHV